MATDDLEEDENIKDPYGVGSTRKLVVLLYMQFFFNMLAVLVGKELDRALR
jgi:hypothetical protein